jgi:transposase
MLKVSLTEEERQDLKKLRLSRKSNRGERAYYVLLSDRGQSPPEIAKQLNRNIITVRLWLKRYLERGIVGLKSQKQAGRPAKKALIIESKLPELLNQTPQTYGYQEAGWQISLLRDWFEKQGCKACENTIVKALNKLRVVYKRFSKTMPLNIPSSVTKKAKVSEIVETIKKESPEDIEIFFADESHFSNQPYVNRGWFKRGEKKW